MNRVKHNPSFQWTRKPKLVHRLLCLFLVSSLTTPNVAHALGAGALLGLPQMQNLLLTIAVVNKAMRTAAENPMDKWRRIEVQRAISMLPAAIVGMAGLFQAGQLGANSFPTVMAMAGGFVDQKAPDMYDKFLKNPRPDLVPNLGAQFPKEYLKKAETANLVTLETGLKGANVGYMNAAVQKKEIADVIDANSFSGFKAPASKTEIETAKTGTLSTKDTTGENKEIAPSATDESQGAEEKRSPATRVLEGLPLIDAARSSAPKTSVDSASIARDLAVEESPVSLEPKFSFEAPVRMSGPKEQNKLEAERVKESEALFKSVGSAETDEDSAADEPSLHTKKNKAVPKATPAKKVEKKELGPVSWRLKPFLFAMNFLLGSEARAEQEEEKDGGGGGGFADILFGIAAIIAAIAPMVVASIEANAKIEQAKIEAATTRFVAEQQKETALTTAQMTRDTALQQAAVTKEVAMMKEDYTTLRQKESLKAVSDQQEAQRQMDRDRWAAEQEQVKTQLALQEKQDALKLEVARATAYSQAVQAGLAPGLTTPGTNNNRLAINSVASNTNAGRISAVQNVNNASGRPTAGAATGQPAAGAGGAASVGLKGALALTGNSTMGAGSANKLLVSATSGVKGGVAIGRGDEKGLTSTGKGGIDGIILKRGADGATYGFASATAAGGSIKGKLRGVKRSAHGAYAHGLALLAQGSFPEERLAIADTQSNSDLGRFIGQAASQNDSFGEWQRSRAEGAVRRNQVPKPAAGHGHGHTGF